MGRSSRKGGSSSPIKKYVSFSGSTGMFSYYDKSKEEKVEVEEVKMTVLDVRVSVSGYNQDSKETITSNMISNQGDEILKVVGFKDKKPRIIAEGLYKDIKEDVKVAKGKFTSNIIGLADLGDGEEIINLQLSGVSLGGWIEYASEHPNQGFYDYFITLNKGVLSKRDGGENVPVTKAEEEKLDKALAKNPRAPRPVWYYTLDVSGEDLTEEQLDAASEGDETLQSYFDSMKEKSNQNTPDRDVKKSESKRTSDSDNDSDEDEEEHDDLPF
jgi:hypothetical protein